MNFVLFAVLSALTLASAVAIVLERNIVRAAVWLMFTLLGVAGLFLLLKADFVGATQVLVYVGGTLVLLVFGVMLTASGPNADLKTTRGDWLAAGVISLLLVGVFVSALWNASAPGRAGDSRLPGSAKLGEVMLGMEASTAEAKMTNLPPGVSLLRPQTAYLLPFEAVSVHLLVVLIGAAYLARARRREETP